MIEENRYVERRVFKNQAGTASSLGIKPVCYKLAAAAQPEDTASIFESQVTSGISDRDPLTHNSPTAYVNWLRSVLGHDDGVERAITSCEQTTSDDRPEWWLADLAVIYFEHGPDVGVVGFIDETGDHISYLTQARVAYRLQDFLNSTAAPIAGAVIGQIISSSPCELVAGWIGDDRFDGNRVGQFRSFLTDEQQ